MMLVETLGVTGLYGALAWYFVVVPARRRSASSGSPQPRQLCPAVVHRQDGPMRTLRPTQTRHLTLVRNSDRP